MSLITHIDKIPLFTTISEAELWGSQYGLVGYHEHEVLGQSGYMGGANHLEAKTAIMGGVINFVSAQQMKSAAAGITSTNGGGTTTGGNGGNGGASGSNGEGATERPSEQESGGETSGEGDSGGGRSRGGGATEGGGY